MDLSKRHEPVGDVFTARADRPAGRLTEAEVERYREDGFVAGARLLDTDQLEALRRELDELTAADHDGRELWYEYHTNESEDPDAVLFHALGAWRIRPGFHDLLWHRELVARAEQLLDGPVRFWHDQLFCKPARHGGVVAWHQDYSYWTRTEPIAHLTVWIALDDSTVDNGCLHYVRGSHRWDLLPITGLAGDMHAIENVLDDAQREAFRHPQPVELRAGEASFHHPLAVHGSFANGSPRPRRAVVVNLVRDGVRSASDEPLLAGTDPIPAGAPLGGRFHPRLSD